MPELRIKAFGRDRTFSSVDELRTILMEEYRGEHVSIVFPTKPNGLLKVVFVSVSQSGEIRESYGNEDLVDFNMIKDLVAV